MWQNQRVRRRHSCHIFGCLVAQVPYLSMFDTGAFSCPKLADYLNTACVGRTGRETCGQTYPQPPSAYKGAFRQLAHRKTWQTFQRDLTNLRFQWCVLSSSTDPLDTRIRWRVVGLGSPAPMPSFRLNLTASSLTRHNYFVIGVDKSISARYVLLQAIHLRAGRLSSFPGPHPRRKRLRFPIVGN